ncbi:MAG: hypothetical protein NT091_00945 [Candidatus Falkowbacteria bacterium]|nr:hypothetical protein [Candidatus Falkowbacteria bacterium]
MRKYFQAVFVLIGTIIGVGMFSMPYIISKAGLLFLLIYLPVLGCVEYFTLKLYAEIILSTKENHRLPGYATKYLGKKSKWFTSIVTTLGNYGAILAYIIVGGIFSHALFGPIWGGSLLLHTTGMFLVESLIVLLGLKYISKAETYLTTLLLIVTGVIVWKAKNYINLSNYTQADWSLAALPYGPILFAVGGGTAVPMVCQILKNDKKKIKSALGLGLAISLFVMFVFVITVVGVTGANTSVDTLAGLNLVLGDEMVKVALLFGILAIATSFFTSCECQREVYSWDFKMNNTFAWALACGVPYILYILGVQNLTTVVSLTGAVTGGLLGILLILIALKVKKKADLKSIIQNKINIPIAILISSMFILGVIYELVVLAKDGF